MVSTHLPWGGPLLILACAACALPGERLATVAPLQLAEPATEAVPAPASPLAEPALVASPVAAPVVYTIEPGQLPRTLEVGVGQELVFVNRDLICHAFFSSSAPNVFDVGMLQPQDRASVRFSHPGTVHVYCALHDHRQLTIQVVPTATAAPAAPAR